MEFLGLYLVASSIVVAALILAPRLCRPAATEILFEKPMENPNMIIRTISASRKGEEKMGLNLEDPLWKEGWEIIRITRFTKWDDEAECYYLYTLAKKQ